MNENPFPKIYHPRILVLLNEIESIEMLFVYENIPFLSNYIWVVFDEDNSLSEKLTECYIPYDCRFLVIKNLKETFEIEEIFHMTIFERNIQVREFVKNDDFYKGRFDMNGSYLTVQVLEYVSNILREIK